MVSASSFINENLASVKTPPARPLASAYFSLIETLSSLTILKASSAAFLAAEASPPSTAAEASPDSLGSPYFLKASIPFVRAFPISTIFDFTSSNRLLIFTNFSSTGDK